MTTREFWRRPDEGDAIWLLGGLYTFKARGDETANAFSLFEVQGLVAAPRHLHEREEEAFYVVDGEVTLAIGNEEIEGTRGAFALVPRGVEHTFKMESPDAKLLLLTPGNAGHEELFTEMGEPAGPRDPAAPLRSTGGGAPCSDRGPARNHHRGSAARNGRLTSHQDQESFDELPEIFSREAEPDLERFGELCERYGLRYDFGSG